MSAQLPPESLTPAVPSILLASASGVERDDRHVAQPRADGRDGGTPVSRAAVDTAW